ncbi:uncharacterized protein LOC125055604 isoform X1 [Pieris napi]|uniref:uncharacterized protein LOC125055604 isoform X1 n=2 Tax=Pieris napi TaxID=78633 RepID=UPI001FB942B3|nr:uncharacterized protein LOC125055604 isoform X1 [Pieris napi]
MSDKINREYFPPGAPAFNYNATGGADSASGGSGGSGMECMQLRSPPGPFHYLISEQVKSLVALQELQNEVGALLEFRDLVIETFPNLRSKMAPSTPASGTRRDWEPGVRVRRKLAAGSSDSTRAKPQPSVQDSGFSTETSCSKDAHSSASAPSASRSRPVEDELWALLDVIQRKGSRLRDEAELLRGELDERQSDTAEESFARHLSHGCADADVVRLRSERDALLARAAQLEALAATSPPPVLATPLGRLDTTLGTPPRPPRVSITDKKKFTAILQESNPVELRRQLLYSIAQNQVYSEQLKRAAEQRSLLLEKLDRATEHNEDLKFRLEEKSVELDSMKSKLQKNSSESLERRDHNSMRDMEPLNMPDEAKITETPRRKPSKIPLHTAHKGAAPRPPLPSAPPRPSSAHSSRSARSTTSARSRTSRDTSTVSRKEHKSAVPVRRTPDNKKQDVHVEVSSEADRYRDSLDAKRIEAGTKLVAEYLARTDRLAPLFPKLHTVRTRPLPENLLQDCRIAYETPQNLALELSKSILYDNSDSIDLKTLNINSDASLWDGKPQQYFESMNENLREFDDDSLAS